MDEKVRSEEQECGYAQSSLSPSTWSSDSLADLCRVADGCFGDATFKGDAPARCILFGTALHKQMVLHFNIQDNNVADRPLDNVNRRRNAPVLQSPLETFSKMNKIMHQTLKYVKEVESINFSSSEVRDFNDEVMEDPRRMFLSVCASVFSNFSFCSHLDVEKLLSFLTNLFENFSDGNAYHNAAHAADSVQMLYLILREKPTNQLFTDDEIVTAFLATLCLSFVHPGVTNVFLTRIDHPLTLVYGDVTTQQSASLTAFLYFLNREENRFVDLSSNTGTHPVSQYLKELLIETVLGTAPRARASLLRDLRDMAASNSVSLADTRVLLSAIVTLSDSALVFRPRKEFIYIARFLCAEWLRETCEEERLKMEPCIPNLGNQIIERGLALVSDYCRMWLKPLVAATRALIPQDLYDNFERNIETPTSSEISAFKVPDVSPDKEWIDGSLPVFEILRKVTMHAKSLDRKASKRAILNATCGRTVSAASVVSTQVPPPPTMSNESTIPSPALERGGGCHPNRCEHYFSFLQLYDIYDREDRPVSEFAEQLVFLAMQLNPEYIGSYAREGVDASCKEECRKIVALILQCEEAPSTAEVIASPLRNGAKTDGFILRLMEMYTDRHELKGGSVSNGYSSPHSTSRCLLHCHNPVYGGMDRGRKQ
uniref:WGS project CAEQ00000000 data, annotated contig 37 n=1 Tax=Trypanosoma congolense (strain IL3000) TaxID=1068625 RepID=F9WFD5_TRYCI|nr:unnamed protein product [Trypanosoma congolense IL3000]